MEAQHTVDAPSRRTPDGPLGRIGSLIDRTPLRRIATILGLVATILGVLGAWIPSYWGDEAASVMSAERSWPSLFRLLSSIDAVHGVYYMFLHLWIDLFGASEFSTRVPSAIAMGVMVAGIVVLAGRLGGPRLALVAGIVATALPRSTYMSVEARAYSMSAAIAVWATVLLVGLLQRQRSRWAWAAYAALMAVGMYVFLYLGLLLVVHGIVVAILHRERLGRWLLAAGGALILALPIIVLGYLERGQIGFLARRNYATAWNVYSSQWFDPLSAVFCWALILLAAVTLIRALIRMRRAGGAAGAVSADANGVVGDGAVGDGAVGAGAAERDHRLLGVLTLVWLVLPTTALLLGNALVSPMYNIRYLSFCAPAAAILVALGIRALARLTPPRARLLTGATATVVVALAMSPSYVVQREPFAKDDGSDWRAVAEYIDDNARPGDAIVFDQKTKPSRNPRLMVSLYPDRFTGLDDAALVAPFETQAHLWDKVVPNDTLTAEDLGSDVWAVELTGKSKDIPDDVAHLQSLGYEISSSTLVNRTRVFHLVQR
ncbi:mannosyltransferase [Microbacterium resistens]|uniref:Mannosyltransferase n=1 Tax=Microbacterium resistens TaxID=156977 RepID=A0ABU1SA60_9MICO|nr:glycosyltransferase family 39 protein [Microbacterium resistens]MDR6865808.1 mannosyltransferase [Microbacterium resistens]